MENTPDAELQKVLDLADQNEQPLTDEELKRDMRDMHKLDLGEHQNYKTRLVQNRWSQHRNAWLQTTK